MVRDTYFTCRYSTSRVDVFCENWNPKLPKHHPVHHSISSAGSPHAPIGPILTKEHHFLWWAIKFLVYLFQHPERMYCMKTHFLLNPNTLSSTVHHYQHSVGRPCLIQSDKNSTRNSSFYMMSCAWNANSSSALVDLEESQEQKPNQPTTQESTNIFYM